MPNSFDQPQVISVRFLNHFKPAMDIDFVTGKISTNNGAVTKIGSFSLSCSTAKLSI